ncbi:putative calcium-binding protein [Xenococcus sp. PCC 7305]|uniref:NF038122 family metalloprotease n=1 Tax=Xenococcus sp. PCC 7305 TaxID=102125 RepID=UPI0002AD003C|nr:NF038122 family metalloprotease [Xenococcus sp. PCC 7305]ELS00659.1 putative calcium-binding protein [Xenococcus sp. PCC 7305]
MKINFVYTPDVSFEQMIGYEIASIIWGKLFADDVEVNILAKTTDQLNSNVIGGAIPEFHEQHYALFLEYYEADITSIEDQMAFNALQKGNTIDFLLDGDLVGGNTKLKLTTALAKALGMTEAISLDRYVLDESENFIDGTIMMNQDFAWDFNYLRDSEGEEDTLDFLSVALHETGHILGFTSSLDFSLQEETLHSGRTELSNFSPLDLFRFSAGSLAQENPDGKVNDLSIGETAWFSTDGGETLSAKMSTGKKGDGFQASHWERRYDPLGIMDPTLWYQERVSITDLDVLAFDLMGYDLSSEAENVEDLFASESLEVLLAQAKVQLADKLGLSVEYLEEHADVPVSSLELIGELENAYLDNNPTEDSSSVDNSSGSDLENLDDKELKDFFKDLSNLMKKTYEWWAQNNGGGSSSWQELYEWWAQNNGEGSSSWQELYEWWAQNNGGGSSSWQELYEWWAQNNDGGSSAWQELYEWWSQDNDGEGSWWQEVFFASQDDGNWEDVELPGASDSKEVGANYYKEITGGNDDDIIGGDLSDDEINAKQGDDLIDGAEGHDTIKGGAGFDTIFGFDGNDSIMGGEGDDVISGESDNDVLLGEAGADVLMGGDHDDYLDGGAGRDFLSGNTGHDVLIGGTEDDALEGGAGKDLLVGGAGEDIGNGGSGDDFIFGDGYSESFNHNLGDDLSNLKQIFDPANTENAEVTANTNGNDNETDSMVAGQNPIRIEAEDLSWSGNYKVMKKNFASGGRLIKNKNNNQAIAGTTTFTGETGTYKIIIGYHDIDLKTGEIQFKLNDNLIDSWQLNKDIDGNKPSSENFTTHTIENISLTKNQFFTIQNIVSSDKGGEGSLDYIEFVPVVDLIATNNLVLGQDPITVEAESLSWSGNYRATNKGYASGGGLIQNNTNDQWIAGEDVFTGKTGVYDIVIGYHDIEIDNGTIQFQVNNTQIDSWDLSQNLHTDILAAGNFTTHRISNVSLNNNDSFTLRSMVNESYYGEGSLDYVKFILVENPESKDSRDSSPEDIDSPPEAISITPEFELGLNSDVLRGGAGNDGIDGGEGNDMIFGEDELNDSSNITPPLIENALHYGHSSYILSQAGTWEEAQAEAQSYGGNLVTINDAGEEQWLVDNFGFDQNGNFVNEAFWIGLTDQETEGQWQWTNGEAMTYNNQSSYSHIANNEDYGVINLYEVALNTSWWSNNQTHYSTEWGAESLTADYSWNGTAWLAPEGHRGIIEIDWSSVGGNDTIFGGNGDDQVYGNTGNDVIYGDDLSTSISVEFVSTGDSATSSIETYNDNIFGNGGHDIIKGGAGDDVINGTDGIVAGRLERDTLEGGAGADKFILGDGTKAFYATGGAQDYVVIQDFNSSEDTVQLFGVAGDYQKIQQGNNIHITRNGDLVAILENNNTLSINGSGDWQTTPYLSTFNGSSDLATILGVYSTLDLNDSAFEYVRTV